MGLVAKIFDHVVAWLPLLLVLGFAVAFVSIVVGLLPPGPLRMLLQAIIALALFIGVAALLFVSVQAMVHGTAAIHADAASDSP